MKKVSILRCLETSCHTLREGERKTFVRFTVALALVHIHNQNLCLTKKETQKKEKHGHDNSKWDLGVCQRVTLKRIDDYCNVLAKRVLAMISFLVSWKTNTDVCWVYCRSSMYAKQVFL